ncbi:hypothetical protein AB205_0091620 [Aquarana catesbeiana]|uniref:Uncharacterized protein n=1 Tax=Aquarana catesbeiana TaxID=8400 RepID=A0A2G9QLE6_AQUCT|nr:hypothetical protein AB205_0091620 [Aquarana catesbeiana]
MGWATTWQMRFNVEKCDVDVVEEESHFTSASAHVLIGEIMVCIRDLELIKENINDVQKK